jgi:hypothetical protein
MESAAHTFRAHAHFHKQKQQHTSFPQQPASNEELLTKGKCQYIQLHSWSMLTLPSKPTTYFASEETILKLLHKYQLWMTI